MGIKKLALGLVPILFISVVLFQNCGKFITIQGNGDPYEGYGTTDEQHAPANNENIDTGKDDQTTTVTAPVQNIELGWEKDCTGSGLIKQIQIVNNKIKFVISYNGNDQSTEQNFNNGIPNNYKVYVNTPDGKVHNISIDLTNYKNLTSIAIKDQVNGVEVSHPTLVCK